LYCTLVARRNKKSYAAAGLKEFYFLHFSKASMLAIIIKSSSIKYYLIFFIPLAHYTSVAQVTRTIAPAKASSALEKVLIREMYDFTNAWGKGDTATLSKKLAPEYRHSDVFGEIQDKYEWLILAAKKKDIANLEINDTEILMYYDNMAVITGKMNYLFGAEKIKQDIRFTQIFVNYDGQWKRTAFQGTYIKN